ncbi:MAG: hypothetical protein II840_06540 [Kiritimatiellae bacterium]|nr:hypothetical protein [Kiritimatiellia bacterium]
MTRSSFMKFMLGAVAMPSVVLTSRTAEHTTGRICRMRMLSILKEGHT